MVKKFKGTGVSVGPKYKAKASVSKGPSITTAKVKLPARKKYDAAA